MRRREFITLLGGAAAWPLVARAQQPDRMRRIAVLMGTESDREGRARIAALRQGLQELGWMEDRNFRIDVVWGDADADHIETDAIALVRKSPDVIVANGPVPTFGAQKGHAKHPGGVLTNARTGQYRDCRKPRATRCQCYRLYQF